jgi:hypothetical protein
VLKLVLSSFALSDLTLNISLLSTVEAQDVIKLMLQFLKENNLMETLTTLQNESGISFNTVNYIPLSIFSFLLA